MSAKPDNAWLQRCAQDAGPFLNAALNFLERRRVVVQRGGEGIAEIARQLEAFVYTDSELTDDEIIEGLGAVLALVLIEHFAPCRHIAQDHKHRIRIGEFGTFDPFAALSRALDAEDPLRTFAEEVQTAENEYRNRGPHAYVVQACSERLTRLKPELSIQGVFEYRVRLNDGSEIDLSRLSRFERENERQEFSLALDKILSMVCGAAEAQSCEWPDASRRIFPRLVANSFGERLAKDHRHALWSQPYRRGIQITLVLSYSDRVRFVNKTQAEKWNSAENLLDQALRNLSAKSKKLELLPSYDDAQIMMINQRDGFDAARVLLPDLYARLKPRLGTEILCAIPHRDVIFVSQDSESLRQRMGNLAKNSAQRAPHSISDQIFTLHAHGLSEAIVYAPTSPEERVVHAAAPRSPRAKI